MATIKNHLPKTRFAEFRFYEELNDFLPAKQHKTSFRSAFFGTPSVKDVIQAMGVPHTAVDLILVDGQSVDFSFRLRGDERVAVYPVFERLDISPLIRLRPKPLRNTRFIVDVHLGKLARYLRLLGFDAAYNRDWGNAVLIDLSLREKRIILTRSLEILKQNRVTHGCWLRHHEPRQQLLEVLRALDLFSQAHPFTRCMDCNGRIHEVDTAVIRDQIDPRLLQQHSEFRQCGDCGKISCNACGLARFLFFLLNSLFPKIGIFNTQRLRVKSVIFDTGRLLRLVVPQGHDGGFRNQENDQDADDIEPGHQANTDIAQSPGQAGRPDRAVKHGGHQAKFED